MRALGSRGSLAPWSVLPLSVPRPSPSVFPVPLYLGLWEAMRWLSTAPCVSREENPQNFSVARTYSCESPNRRPGGDWARGWGGHTCPHRAEVVARPDLAERGASAGRLFWGSSQRLLDLCSGQAAVARAPAGHSLRRGADKVGISPLPQASRGHILIGGDGKEGPGVPTWLSSGQDLAPSSNLRAPEAASEGPARGAMGLWFTNPKSSSAPPFPLSCRKDKLLRFSPSVEGEWLLDTGGGRGEEGAETWGRGALRYGRRGTERGRGGLRHGGGGRGD